MIATRSQQQISAPYLKLLPKTQTDSETALKENSLLAKYCSKSFTYIITLILTTTLWGRSYHYHHSIDEETEAPRRYSFHSSACWGNPDAKLSQTNSWSIVAKTSPKEEEVTDSSLSNFSIVQITFKEEKQWKSSALTHNLYNIFS